MSPQIKKLLRMAEVLQSDPSRLDSPANCQKLLEVAEIAGMEDDVTEAQEDLAFTGVRLAQEVRTENLKTFLDAAEAVRQEIGSEETAED